MSLRLANPVRLGELLNCRLGIGSNLRTGLSRWAGGIRPLDLSAFRTALGEQISRRKVYPRLHPEAMSTSGLRMHFFRPLCLQTAAMHNMEQSRP